MKKMFAGVFIVVVGVFFLLASTVLAQEPCTADFNCDQNVDATDVDTFLSQFGRNPYNDPCPDCYDSPCPCSSTIPKTGQTTSYATGDDGDLEKGLVWQNPRFTDNGDGTVIDNLTNLIWLKDAHCFLHRTWAEALSDCNGLSSGQCELTDGSSAGNWRLPSLFELESLRDMNYYFPCLSDTIGTGQWSQGDPFYNVSSVFFWSSTTYAELTIAAWGVDMTYGYVTISHKLNELYVWPVRDPL